MRVLEPGLDIFQFLLGCYALREAPPGQVDKVLSIPFRMLLVDRLDSISTINTAFNSF